MSALHTGLQQMSRKSLAIALIASAILGNGAYTIHKELVGKADAQQASLSQINRWKQEYELLKPYQTEWNKTLTSTRDLTDLDRIFEAPNLKQYGLSTNRERIVMDKDEPMSLNGTPLQASRVCLKSSSDRGFSVTAPRFAPDLLNGLEELAKRRDVEIQNIQLTTENGTPKAVMDFCLVFRS